MDSVGEESEEFPGRTCRAQESTGVEKVYSLSSGFADPVTAGHERCIYAYAPDADKGLLTPSCLHPHMETRSRLLHGRCSTFLSLSLPLSFSLSLLAPFLFPVSLSLSLGSILPPPPPLSVCSISPSQRILKTLHLSNPLRIHPPRGRW